MKLRCFQFPYSCHGFTLMEILIVVVIMAISAALMAPVMTGNKNQAHFTATVETMSDIRTALLGTPSERIRGDARFAGYVQDMGDLPDLVDGQPKGLWTYDPNGTPGNDSDDLVYKKLYWFKRQDFIRVGWCGPYIKPPRNGAFKDGWGNSLVFKKTDNSLVITSLGADGAEGGTDFDTDISIDIKARDWTGSVSGYLPPLGFCLKDDEVESDVDYTTIRVAIYTGPGDPDCKRVTLEGNSASKLVYNAGYPLVDCIEDNIVMGTVIQETGYFYFDKVPVGTQRLLLGTQKEDNDYYNGYKITVESGQTWLGTLPVQHH